MYLTIEEELRDKGYEICNAEILSANISMEDHSCITFSLNLKGHGWLCPTALGGYCLGHGYVGADPKNIDSSPKGLALIAQVMNIVGVSKFSDLKGKYVRVAKKSHEINIIGNIIEDKWFNVKEFLQEE